MKISFLKENFKKSFWKTIFKNNLLYETRHENLEIQRNYLKVKNIFEIFGKYKLFFEIFFIGII